jgi:hypothetical protein
MARLVPPAPTRPCPARPGRRAFQGDQLRDRFRIWNHHLLHRLLQSNSDADAHSGSESDAGPVQRVRRERERGQCAEHVPVLPDFRRPITTVGGGIFGLTADILQRNSYSINGIFTVPASGTYTIGACGSSLNAANWTTTSGGMFRSSCSTSRASNFTVPCSRCMDFCPGFGRFWPF